MAKKKPMDLSTMMCEIELHLEEQAIPFWRSMPPDIQFIIGVCALRCGASAKEVCNEIREAVRYGSETSITVTWERVGA